MAQRPLFIHGFEIFSLYYHIQAEKASSEHFTLLAVSATLKKSVNHEFTCGPLLFVPVQWCYVSHGKAGSKSDKNYRNAH